MHALSTASVHLLLTAVCASLCVMVVQVTEKPLKLRQGVALTSRPLGVLAQGRKLKVVDTRVWRRDGTLRVCVASADSEEGGNSILPLGWVTIQAPTMPSTRPTIWPSAPMEQPPPVVESNLTPVHYSELDA